MNVKLAKLPLGNWRELSKKELNEISQLLANSKSEPAL
jgi:16S rRNA U516 pseudouridylate synthase RsuA-like enzyme